MGKRHITSVHYFKIWWCTIIGQWNVLRWSSKCKTRNIISLPACCFSAYFLILNMAAVPFFETSVNLYQTTRNHIPEYINLQLFISFTSYPLCNKWNLFLSNLKICEFYYKLRLPAFISCVLLPCSNKNGFRRFGRTYCLHHRHCYTPLSSSTRRRDWENPDNCTWISTEILKSYGIYKASAADQISNLNCICCLWTYR
jgi:hypothetical protein